MKLVLLDRDGVINVDRPDSVKSLEEFVLLPKVIDAIKKLKQFGLHVAIVTNQAIVGRGKLTTEALDDIHDYLQQLLKKEGTSIDKIYACTSCDDSHPDRKPNPGLIYQAIDDFQVTPLEVVVIGDALRDLQAAKKAGCCRYLVRTGKGQLTLQNNALQDLEPMNVFDDLYDASSYIVERMSC